MQDEGSEVEVKLDGTPLKKGEETKLGVGMTISYGSTEYKASPCYLTTVRVSATWTSWAATPTPFGMQGTGPS